ncbi:MAG: Panacea domain-containing protein [Syntrophorhabdus sp.]
MVKAKDVATLFLSWANTEGDLITNLKMQKLLYYAHAWHLANFHKPLFADRIEAWDLGPVIPSLYHDYKKYGGAPIRYKVIGKEHERFSSEQLDYLQAFYDRFIRFSAHELVNMSHNEQPWKTAFRSRTKLIDDDSMEQYYSALLKRKRSR